MNILALFAHPDDVECICAGTLLKYKQAGHKIFIALTTSGNTGSNQIDSREQIAAIRESEMLESAKYLDAEVMFLTDVRRRLQWNNSFGQWRRRY